MPVCSMVLVYLPTKLDDFVRANVGKYSIHGAYGIGSMGFYIYVYIADF